MLSRQDKHHIILIYTVGFIILLLSGMSVYKIIYEPARNELRSLHRQLSEQTPTNVAGSNISFGEYAAWQNAVPNSPQQAYQKIMSLVSQASVQLHEIRFDERQASKPFYELPVYLNVTGSFTDILHFLIVLSNTHMTFSFDQVALMQSESAIQAALRLRVRIVQ